MVDTRSRASALIRAGEVLVEERVVDKAGTRIADDASIRLRKQACPYVSRGGLKLQHALESFEIEVDGLCCVDLGASTGGFTDCLLQRGARKVYAIDVGYGQLAWKLRTDERVVVMERTNARHLESLPETIDLLVADLSFISLHKVVPAMQRIAPGSRAVLLIKPQFEAGPGQVSKGGVVRDPVLRAETINKVLSDLEELGCTNHGTQPSPIPGAKKGNIEELVFLELPE
jgi:23S rRNA (cytidine1920-2'-O)/16S rRNA (cytidine1409-2'-O)-methyltransferase